MNSNTDTKTYRRSGFDIVWPVIVLIILLAVTWRASQSGYGALLANYAAVTDQLSAATGAVGRDPRNADAHYIRATILEASDLRAAVTEHLNAVKSRPEDYALWLSLARANELFGTTESAIAAARQAALLAPAYSQPHYQLGNMLLRIGRTNEAFAELRRAAESDPALLPGIIDLAFRTSGGDAQFVLQALAPNTHEARITMANYFRVRDQVDAAIELYTAAGTDAVKDRAYYVGQLISANKFKDAARLWAVDHSDSVARDQIRDPGFEKDSDLSEAGFSWRAGDKTEGLRFVLDTRERAEGNSSLRIEFGGSHDPASPVISQLISVQPDTLYELRLSMRTENLVSGGLPRVAVLDAVTRVALTQSSEVDRTSHGWREFVLQFKTGPQIETIQIVVQRQGCATQPCPIFGQLWLDQFSLRRV
jgi:hypothetical protein